MKRVELLIVVITFALAGCDSKPPAPTLYLWTVTQENADGSTISMTYEGPKPLDQGIVRRATSGLTLSSMDATSNADD